MNNQLLYGYNDYKELTKIKNGSFDEQVRELLEKFPLDRFKGRFPIRILINNFTEAYNSMSVSATLDLKSLTENDILDRELRYLINEDMLTAPSVKIPTKTDDKYIMEFGESFVAYTWSLTYYLFLKYEYCIQIALNKCSKFYITEVMMKRAYDLFLWGISLNNNVHTCWPQYYPDPYPTSKLIDSEAIYCLKVNNLVKKIISFIMFHELGHVALGHKNSSIEIEQEADNSAFDYVLNCMEPGEELGNCLVAILGMGEMLFLCNSLSDVHASFHPDIHRRINNALQKALDNSEGIEKELKFMVCILYDTFFQLNNKVEDWKFDDFNEVIENYESILDTYC